MEELKWHKVEDSLPTDEVIVLCFHEYSKNYFICHRTKDCFTQEPKWQGGALPTHWKYLDTPSEQNNPFEINQKVKMISPEADGEYIKGMVTGIIKDAIFVQWDSEEGNCHTKYFKLRFKQIGKI